MQQRDWAGVLPAITTPFKPDLSVDEVTSTRFSVDEESIVTATSKKRGVPPILDGHARFRGKFHNVLSASVRFLRISRT